MLVTYWQISDLCVKSESVVWNSVQDPLAEFVEMDDFKGEGVAYLCRALFVFVALLSLNGCVCRNEFLHQQLPSFPFVFFPTCPICYMILSHIAHSVWSLVAWLQAEITTNLANRAAYAASPWMTIHIYQQQVNMDGNFQQR